MIKHIEGVYMPTDLDVDDGFITHQATWSWPAMKAPEEMPETVIRARSIWSVGSGSTSGAPATAWAVV